MKLYNVSFEENNIRQALLANARSEFAVYAWFQMSKPNATVTAILPARPDDEKPGMPRIEIPTDYMPYLRAADDMTRILQREKGMTCRFYIMDEAYYSNIAYPQLSCDNRRHPLTLGDWYVIVTCSDGYPYYVNVTADSVTTMCAEVFGFIQNK